MNKILVIGNDSSINDIDFSQIDSKVITIGTNRAWLKLIPNYLFFHDVKIFQELNNDIESLNELKHNCKFISSDWLKTRCTKEKVTPPAYTTIYNRPNRYKFVDCVTNAIEIYDRYISNTSENTYYVAGVSLTWKTPSHFWKKEQVNGIGNTLGPAWYEPRFKRIYENFEDLRRKKFNIISVSPGSKINKLLRYEHIGNLYS